MSPLQTQLLEIQHIIPSLNCRVVPSSFDPSDEHMLVVPRPLHFEWRTCKQILEAAQSRAVANRMPIFWQMQTALHDACRSLGIPIFLSEPSNIPLGAISLALANIDTIVSEARDMDELITYISQKGLPQPLSWIGIHRVEDLWQIPDAIASSVAVVAQEVHLLPSLPVLTQCIALARVKSNSFHLSDAFEWSLGSSQTAISSSDQFLPLTRLVLPFLLREAGTCVCGASLYQRV